MRTYTIIIIENDEDERMFMKEGFDATGLFAILAILRNGDDLLSWIEQNPAVVPDLILSDLNMPGKNGYDIIVEMRAHPLYASVPVVITSTSSTLTIINKCLERGAADYLVKPDTFVEYGPYVEMLYRRITEKQLVK